jgi:GH15 family glucan-1,4-alpha-glucosidase
LARVTALGLAAAAFLGAARDAQAAEQRTWNYLPTGNGHGFQVYSAEKHRITHFLEHPYRYLRGRTVPAPPPESEGVGRRNLAFDVFFGLKSGGGAGWLSEPQASEAPEYVDQSNIIRAPTTVGGTKAESFFFAPFGFERNVMVGLLHAPGASDGYALFNFHMGGGGSETEPDAAGESVRAAAGVPKAVVERGPNGRGAMIYVPIGGADHVGCSDVFNKGKGGQDLADDCTSSGNDIAVGLQKKLGADGWMGVAATFVDNEADADAAAAAVNTWIAGRAPDKVLDDAKKEFEAWRKPVPAGTALCSEDEKKLWRMSEAVLRMGQVREPNIPGRKNNGMILASLPVGEWHTGWVRDAIYAIVALARIGHHEEARMALDFFMNAFEMNPPGMQDGKYKSYVRNKPYRISVTRHYGNGEEESDTNQDGPNVETDGWGMVLWAARTYVEQSGDVAWLDKATFSGSTWDVLTGGIADAVEGQLESNGIMAADSSIWETHEAKKRHFAFTTLAAARGLCDMAGLAKKANKGDLVRYQNAAKRVREGFLSSFVDPQGALAGSIEGLGNGKYTDGAVAEAFTWNILQDWTGDTAKATLSQLGKLRVDSGGYKRNDDGLSSYDNNEWILVDLRIANSLRRAGRGPEGDGVVAKIVQKAVANFLLIPELYNAVPTDGQVGKYTGSIPMVGYGGGAYVITMMDRSGLIEANDCGDGKGMTLPKVDCGGISTNPGGPGGGDGGVGGGPNDGVPDTSQIPYVGACLCRQGQDRGMSPIGFVLFMSVPAFLVMRRAVRRFRSPD